MKHTGYQIHLHVFKEKHGDTMQAPVCVYSCVHICVCVYTNAYTLIPQITPQQFK